MSRELLAVLGKIRDDRVKYINVRASRGGVSQIHDPRAFLQLLRDSPWRMVPSLFELLKEMRDRPQPKPYAPPSRPKKRQPSDPVSYYSRSGIPKARALVLGPEVCRRIRRARDKIKRARDSASPPKPKRSRAQRRTDFYNANDLAKGYAWLQGRAAGVASLRTRHDSRLPSLDDYDNRPRRLLGYTDIRLKSGFDILAGDCEQ